MSKTTSPSKSDRIEKDAFATRRQWNPHCRHVDSEWKRNQNELPEEVRQLLNASWKKRFRDLAAMITVLFGRIRLAETKRREWRV